MTNEEAIKILKIELEPVDPLFSEVQQALDMAIEALSAEPKTGEWVEIENGEYLCSNCSRITIGYPLSNCPHCFARMKGGDIE